MTTKRTFIGLTCGQALDGVEAALVDVEGAGDDLRPRFVRGLSRPLPAPLRGRLAGVLDAEIIDPRALEPQAADLASVLASAASELLAEAGRKPESVSAVGCGGPDLGAGIELPDPQHVAAACRLPAVGGFEASDLAAGGVGGPVDAWPLWRMLRHERLSRVAVRLGGVATVTFIGSAAEACEVVSYDVGPGTLLTDALARRLLGRPHDADGAVASRGRAREDLLNELSARGYFGRRPPKRTRRREWLAAEPDRLLLTAARHGLRQEEANADRSGASDGGKGVPSARKGGDSGGEVVPGDRTDGSGDAEDLLATVTELTARLVVRAIDALTERPHEVILFGGGALNIHLAGRIRALMSPSSTYAVERYGLDARCAQAACRAVLAAARLDAFAAHCHAATGAAAPSVLGAVASR